MRLGLRNSPLAQLGRDLSGFLKSWPEVQGGASALRSPSMCGIKARSVGTDPPPPSAGG